MTEHWDDNEEEYPQLTAHQSRRGWLVLVALYSVVSLALILWWLWQRGGL